MAGNPRVLKTKSITHRY